MKHLFALLLSILCYRATGQQQLVQFKISRPVCVLTFLQTASGDMRHMSVSLKDSIDRNMNRIDTTLFHKVINEFSNLTLDHSYIIAGYPDGRQRPRNTMDLLMIAAVQSNTVQEFLNRSIGILPNETWLKLSYVMQAADPLYDKVVWSPNQRATTAMLATLNGYDNRLDDIFSRLSRFYGSTWTRDIPFTVAVYPVPGKRGNTTATPHSNSLVMAVLTEEKDIDMRVAVAVHEICHVLYGEQPIVLQQRMEKWFTGSKDPNAAFAYSYIDEGLATACGNAWAYEQLTGKMDTGEWYNDEYINKYAHALYPLVKDYMQAAKPLDSVFVVKAIAQFSLMFPSAYRNYNNLLNRVNFYTDPASESEYNDVSIMLNNTFRISSSYNSYPISESIQQLDAATGTQLFIIYREHAANYKILSGKFSELKGISPSQEGIVSFFDKQKRPVIIVNVKDKSRVKKGLEVLAKARDINKEKIFVPLDQD